MYPAFIFLMATSQSGPVCGLYVPRHTTLDAPCPMTSAWSTRTRDTGSCHASCTAISVCGVCGVHVVMCGGPGGASSRPVSASSSVSSRSRSMYSTTPSSVAKCRSVMCGSTLPLMLRAQKVEMMPSGTGICCSHAATAALSHRPASTVNTLSQAMQRTVDADASDELLDLGQYADAVQIAGDAKLIQQKRICQLEQQQSGAVLVAELWTERTQLHALQPRHHLRHIPRPVRGLGLDRCNRCAIRQHEPCWSSTDGVLVIPHQ